MRPLIAALLLVLAAGAALLAPAAVTHGEGPTGSAKATTIQALAPGEGERSTVLSARLTDSDGQPVAGVRLSFYIVTTVFGERLMKVGEPLTDTTGTAWVVYEQSWEGDHSAVVRFGGSDDYTASQAGFSFVAKGAPPLHENAKFGLEPVRALLPVAVGAVVLAVWAALGFVALRTIVLIPGGAAVEPRTAPALPALPSLRPASLAPRLAVAFAAVVMAIAGGWFLMRQQGPEELLLSGGNLGGGNLSQYQHETELGAPVPLPVVASLDLPADAAPQDVATIDGRAFLVAGETVLSLPADGGAAVGLGESLQGASAIASHEGRLYVASALTADIAVVDTSGVLQRVITPVLPAEQRPLRPAGLAITGSGEIWISDPENHRVVLIDEAGTLLRSIGEDWRQTGVYAFQRPAGLALDEAGNLYVVDAGTREVKKFSPLGVFLGTIGVREGGEALLLAPRDVAVDSAGTIFISCEGHQYIHAFAPNGTYLGYVTPDPAGSGFPNARIEDPDGLAVDGERLYVTDRAGGLLALQLETAPGH